MNIIVITKVIIHNLRSFTDCEITFNQSSGLKHISGENLVVPRLGANGVGKSSLLNAINWCFFGVGIKGERASSMLTWGKEEMKVTTELLVDGLQRIISRSSPPNRVEIDGQIKEQKDIEEIIKLSRLRFQHSIIFGQGVALFPDISIPDRGELLDEVLNLNVWTKCGDSSSMQASKFEKQLSDKRRELAFIQGKLDGFNIKGIESDLSKWELMHELKLKELREQLKDWENKNIEEIFKVGELKANWQTNRDKQVEDITNQQKAWIDDEQSKLRSKEADKKLLESDLSTANKVIQSYNRKTTRSDINPLENKISTLISKVAVAKNKINSIIESEKLWQQKTCPVCEQDISEFKKKEKEQHFADTKTKLQLELKTAEDELTTTKQSLIDLRQEILKEDQEEAGFNAIADAVRKEVKARENQLRSINHDIEWIEKGIENNHFNRQIVRLKVELNPYIEQEQKLYERINPYTQLLVDEQALTNPFLIKLAETRVAEIEFEESRKKAEQECNDLSQLITCTDYWRHGFKRIRLFFVQKVLQALEIEIASALSALGLQGWKIKLATETETKSQTVKLGIQIRVTNPAGIEAQWESWSGGESQRLRLGIALGLASLIQRAAGVEFKFEAFDEPTSWLGNEGIEDLLESLRYRAESRDKQIFVADHRALTFSGFKEIWMVRKEEAGSQMFLVAEAEA